MNLFRRTALTCVITAFVGGVLVLSPFGHALEQDLGLSALFRLRGAVPPPPELLVVSINESSAVRLDQPTQLRDWDRTLHAGLVNMLTARGASAIVFDVFFEQSRTDGSDAEFARAIGDSRRVVLVQQVARDQHDLVTVNRLVNPVPELAGAALGLAPFPLPKIGNRFDRFWVFFQGVSDSPTLPMVALQVHVIGLYGYEGMVQALRAAGMNGDVEFPSQVTGWRELRNLMDSLRSTLRSRPEVYRAARERLEQMPGANALQALVDTYAGKDSYYLNFHGPPGSIKTVRYSDFWSDSETQRRMGLLDLAGKVVFVGGVSQSSNLQIDGFYTVFSRADGLDIHGVEIAATAVANMLQGRTLQPASMIANLGIVLLFGVAVAVLSRRFSAALTAVPVIAVGAGYCALSYYLFSVQNLWLPLVIPVAVQLPLALSLGYLAQYLNARRAREKYSQSIRYYVPERVAMRLDEGEEPSTEPELVFGVCMSTDIAGYTTLAERIPETELVALTAGYFEQLAKHVERHGGEMLEVRGDGMNSVWSAPEEDRTLSHRASLAACEILEFIERHNRQHESRQLPTRIGLHAGRVALGNVGGGGHLAFSVVGDSMNTAARIQDLNKVLGTRLLASAEVVESLDEWRYRQVCVFQPKGKAEVLSIYEVIGPNDAATNADKALCELFKAAIRLVANGNWEDAAAAFAEILRSRPGDGPSSFWLNRCGEYSVSAPPAGMELVIGTERQA